jgi:L-threonylcarbamoyladenylate synthase
MRIESFSSAAIDEALSILREGGVIAHATETCYGLACDIANEKAVRTLFAIKNRPEHQPVSGLFASVEDAKQFVEWNDKAAALESYLPGPLTLILPLKENAALYPTPSGGTTMGVRVSSHPDAHMLVAMYGTPLTTTSANLHGQPNPYSAADIAAQFAESLLQPDLILDSGVLPSVPPSTVVDCSGENLQKKREGGLHL